jgi:hypothetical protein
MEVVSFTRLYLLDRRLGGPQSRSRRGGEEKKPVPAPTENRTPVARAVADLLHSLSYLRSVSYVK